MKRTILTAVVLATVTLGGTACQPTDSGGKNHAEKVVAQQNKQDKGKGDKQDTGDSSAPAKPKYTMAQTQAIGSATDYLDTGSFSRKGLIDQLKFEDFSVADATFALNHMKVDWNVQAQGSAKDYLNTGSFSRQGLIDQLEFEGFTPAQAIYGVNHVGL